VVADFYDIKTPLLPHRLVVNSIGDCDAADGEGYPGLSLRYRVMMVGGRLYPLHLAISRQWKIHYFSADMRDRAEHRAEEAKFLADMPGVLDARAWRRWYGCQTRSVSIMGVSTSA
jgi:hypothetical protein